METLYLKNLVKFLNTLQIYNYIDQKYSKLDITINGRNCQNGLHQNPAMKIFMMVANGDFSKQLDYFHEDFQWWVDDNHSLFWQILEDA